MSGSIASAALPLVIAAIVLAALLRCNGVFAIFTEGAAQGFRTILSIAPSLVGLITAVEMFKASGALDMLVYALTPVATLLRLPPELLPIILLRPISGGGSVALLDRLLSQQGAAAFCSRVACVLCASSETTFYTSALYFGSVGIRRVRHTLICALFADLCGIIISVAVVTAVG